MKNPLSALLILALSASAHARESPDGGVEEPSPAAAAAAHPGPGDGASEDGKLDKGTFACLMLSDDQCGAGANATPFLTAPGGRVAPKVFTADERRFSTLIGSYPNGSVDDVRALIGRSKETWIINTCAIRVSYAMNASGFRIDSAVQDARGLADPNGKINFLTDRSGVRNGQFYVYRVDELARYMLQKYGKPQIWAAKAGKNSMGDPRAAVQGKKGVILFVVKSWSDATGHFDLWDGQRAAHEDYFDKASDVFLWQ